jgi:hypothetical protein
MLKSFLDGLSSVSYPLFVVMPASLFDLTSLYVYRLCFMSSTHGPTPLLITATQLNDVLAARAPTHGHAHGRDEKSSGLIVSSNDALMLLDCRPLMFFDKVSVTAQYHSLSISRNVVSLMTERTIVVVDSFD